MFELFLLAAVGGAGVAIGQARASHYESEHLPSKRFYKAYDKVSPPKGSACAICGDAATKENARILFFGKGSRGNVRVICDKTPCLLAHAEGLARPHHQAVLSEAE